MLAEAREFLKALKSTEASPAGRLDFARGFPSLAPAPGCLKWCAGPFMSKFIKL